ncbi:MAG: hypothetical protein PUB20_06715 [Clostridia bacterium]|nr:hypothetical protein [Clostridia bacterium]
MKYIRPEMDIEKFDIIEEITAGAASAGAGSDSDKVTTTTSAIVASGNVGEDLIVG